MFGPSPAAVSILLILLNIFNSNKPQTVHCAPKRTVPFPNGSEEHLIFLLRLNSYAVPG
jgi:hypothetical protein